MLPRIQKFHPLVTLLACLAFLVPLALFAYTGYFTRYWADDYCYNAVLNAEGFWKAQVSFYTHTSDRYSVIPLVGLSELFGMASIRFWPLVAIVAGMAALVWAIKRLTDRFNWPLSLPEGLLLAEIVLFFTFWQAPNLFQALYWRTGMLTYSMPLVFQVLLVGLIVSPPRKNRLPRLWMVVTALLAFFAGGFSETTAALQAGFLGLALGITLLLRRVAFFQSHSARLLAAAFTGTSLAMVALFLSPSNALRLVHMPQPADPFTLVSLSLRFGLDFVIDTLNSQPLPTLVSLLAAFAAGLAFWARAGEDKWLTARYAGFFLLISLLGAYLLIVCCVAPSVYVEVAYPEARALIAARFVMTLGLVSAGWLMGAMLVAIMKQHALKRFALPVALLLLALLSLYPLRSARAIAAEVPHYQQRALTWDQRDQEIREQRAAGRRDIIVPAMDSIAGLLEFQPQPDNWLNNCAAGMYGVQSITGENP